MKKQEYTYMIGDMSQVNLRALVKHCDKKIDKYFSGLSKHIEKIVKAEVRKILKAGKK